MPVITAGTTGASWGLTAETGIIAQTFGFKPSKEFKEERGPQGDDVLLAWFNPKLKYTIAGVTVGTSGVAAANPGVALVIANDPASSGAAYGVSGSNAIYVDGDGVDLPQANVEFRKINVSGTKYALIA